LAVCVKSCATLVQLATNRITKPTKKQSTYVYISGVTDTHTYTNTYTYTEEPSAARNYK